jgi:branched-chain amino acid aminotransferase
MANLCNLDGVILAEAEARVPVLDRGFLFGDSIYEVVRTSAGVPFAWPEHYARLRLSAAALLLELDLPETTIARRVAATVAAAKHGDSYVRIVVTRGTGSAPNIDLAYATGKPCWAILVRPLVPISGQPARVAIVQRLRNDRRALDPATKSGNYLNNVLGLAEAKQLGATDCLMCNQLGFVTEASTSNVWARIDGVWCTPPLTSGILAGVTRALLIDCLQQHGHAVAERDLTPADIENAEEVVLSSSLRDVSPVTHLNGRARNDGKPGPAAMRLLSEFAAYSQNLLRERYTPYWQRLLTS